MADPPGNFKNEMIILWIGRNPVSLMRGERHVPVRHTPLTLETIETIHRTGLDRSRYPPAKAEGRHASQVFKICVEWPGVVSSNREEQSWPQGQVKFKIVVTHPL